MNSVSRRNSFSYYWLKISHLQHEHTLSPTSHMLCRPRICHLQTDIHPQTGTWMHIYTNGNMDIRPFNNICYMCILLICNCVRVKLEAGWEMSSQTRFKIEDKNALRVIIFISIYNLS